MHNMQMNSTNHSIRMDCIIISTKYVIEKENKKCIYFSSSD